VENSFKTLWRVIFVNSLSQDVVRTCSEEENKIMENYYYDLVNPENRTMELYDMDMGMQRVFINDWKASIDIPYNYFIELTHRLDHVICRISNL